MLFQQSEDLKSWIVRTQLQASRGDEVNLSLSINRARFNNTVVYLATYLREIKGLQGAGHIKYEVYDFS